LPGSDGVTLISPVGPEFDPALKALAPEVTDLAVALKQQLLRTVRSARRVLPLTLTRASHINCDQASRFARESPSGNPATKLTKAGYWPMTHILNFPPLVFVLAFFALWLSARVGVAVRKRRGGPEEVREDFGVILAATLTLLGLIIGFSFSMAISRYDQRKIYEEEEANAIGTEYVRADLLPAAEAARLRALLKNYLDQRILFYTTRDERQLRQIDANTAQLQNELWATAQAPAAAQPTPVVALAISGMNDVLNSQGYTLAAWRNRIPTAAWSLMFAIAILCNLLIGYGSRRPEAETMLFLVLPLVVSISFFLIADIDSPSSGVIRVNPQNLMSLAQSLPAR
jgi:hypothetical protein